MDRYDIYTKDDARILYEMDNEYGDWVRYEAAAARIAELEAQLVNAEIYGNDCNLLNTRISELEVELDIERNLTNKALDKLAELATNLEAQLAAAQELAASYRNALMAAEAANDN